MHSLDFPGCCTAKVFTGFGETVTAEHEYRPYSSPTQEGIECELIQRVKALKERGMGIATAMTNSDQVTANAALEAQGWEHSKWCTKEQHRDKKIRLWFKCLDEGEG
jgi:hypothetical protein